MLAQMPLRAIRYDHMIEFWPRKYKHQLNDKEDGMEV